MINKIMVIKFHKEYEKWGEFSNYFKTPIRVRIPAEIDADGKTVWNKGTLTENLDFSSREVLFHALKFTQPGNVKIQIIKSFCNKEPGEARRLAKNKNNEFNNLNWWYGGNFSQPGYNVRAMLWTIWQAIKQNENLREELLKSGEEEIVENTQIASYNDDFWGNGKTGQGRNELGKALMKLRTRLRNEKIKWDEKCRKAILEIIDYWNSKKLSFINKKAYINDSNYKKMCAFWDKAIREDYPKENYSYSWEKFIYQKLIVEPNKDFLKYFKKKIDEHHPVEHSNTKPTIDFNDPVTVNEKNPTNLSLDKEKSKSKKKIEPFSSEDSISNTNNNIEDQQSKLIQNDKNHQSLESKNRKNWIILSVILGFLLMIACFLFFMEKSKAKAK